MNMTDKDLAAFGERLYAAMINTPLSTIEIGGLAAAFRQRTPWPRLGPSLKVALFRIAAKMGQSAPPEAPSDGPKAPEAGSAGAPPDEAVSPESSVEEPDSSDGPPAAQDTTAHIDEVE
jgi:hypothetical protein